MTPGVKEIFDYYQTFLLQQLVGMILYIDFLVKLFENSKGMTTRLIDEYIQIKVTPRSRRSSSSPRPRSSRTGSRRSSSAKKCSSAETSTRRTSCGRG